MNQPNNMSELFDKLDDLKLVFKYGQQMIPIIQSLIDFMKETVPLLEKINTSISDSTAKIPKATNQINNVTSATETATNEILDIVDKISSDISSIESILKERSSSNKIKEILKQNIRDSRNGDSSVIALMEDYWEHEKRESADDNLIEIFNKIKDNSYNITLSLQVQDITAQQLAAVNHLIESVQEKLSSLLFNFKDNKVCNEVAEIDVSKNSAFNPEARYTDSQDKQNVADSLVSERNAVTSQDEIDRLFS